ncbi:MAG: hypothetical protein ACN4GF_06925 [Lentimonas sp.]
MSKTTLNCPHLPEANLSLTHRCLTELDAQTSPAQFYFTALQYGHTLWHKGHAGRAILAVTRALYTDVPANDPILNDWPLPYAALAWIIKNHSSDDFPGNPRISFQHQATRLKGDRQEIRRARAWAVWAIICNARPSLPADDAQDFTVPTIEAIKELLKKHKNPNEAELWIKVLNSVE